MVDLPAPRGIRVLAVATDLAGGFLLLVAACCVLWGVSGGSGSSYRSLLPAEMFTIPIGLTLATAFAAIGALYIRAARGVVAAGRPSPGLRVAGWTSVVIAALAVAATPLYDAPIFRGAAAFAALTAAVLAIHGALVGAVARDVRSPTREAAWWIVVIAGAIAGEVWMFSQPPLAPRPAYVRVSVPIEPAAP